MIGILKRLLFIIIATLTFFAGGLQMMRCSGAGPELELEEDGQGQKVS